MESGEMEEIKKESNFINQPRGIIQNIALNLPYSGLINLCAASKRFNNFLCQNDYFWKQRAINKGIIDKDEISNVDDGEWRKWSLIKGNNLYAIGMDKDGQYCESGKIQYLKSGVKDIACYLGFLAIIDYKNDLYIFHKTENVKIAENVKCVIKHLPGFLYIKNNSELCKYDPITSLETLQEKNIKSVYGGTRSEIGFLCISNDNKLYKEHNPLNSILIRNNVKLAGLCSDYDTIKMFYITTDDDLYIKLHSGEEIYITSNVKQVCIGTEHRKNNTIYIYWIDNQDNLYLKCIINNKLNSNHFIMSHVKKILIMNKIPHNTGLGKLIILTFDMNVHTLVNKKHTQKCKLRLFMKNIYDISISSNILFFIDII